MLGRLPGVKAVSNTRFLPWQGGGSSTETRLAGSQGAVAAKPDLQRGRGYVRDARLAGRRGPRLHARGHRSEDARLAALFATARERGEDGTPKNKISQDVVISRAFARLAFGEGSPLGKRLEDNDGDQYLVVGVIDRFYNPYGWPIHEYVDVLPELVGVVRRRLGLSPPHGAGQPARASPPDSRRRSLPRTTAATCA